MKIKQYQECSAGDEQVCSSNSAVKVLVVDCYDSFTYNLCQQTGSLGAEPVVLKNDTSIEELEEIDFERILLSPGPGKPEDSMLCLDVLEKYHKSVPILGICLGHQAIVHFFGGKVVRTNRPVHGMASEIIHNSSGIFSDVKSPFKAARYHSLAVFEETLPDCLSVTARSADDGTVMAVSHKNYPVFGLQFHPESIITESGDKIIENFLRTGSVL
ncbi:aminodeoxychorismate/anthranilate synthase component II [Methanoplanus sp. FWC-SCC4]|uniref:anthranilate synthase n=1 Tax=Methanochimaera problematica TaxID=2609417 RepID=A0AA97FCH6_9EURY|nr:aminodeoxychorismate/anthranilate synthase component II [Methanoplanus sp. FWC-SCC4]WOF16434.1 aminodeoxychorismate/anthranilate synthase component II [Methanoplanus sp. FWC-SCC4]